MLFYWVIESQCHFATCPVEIIYIQDFFSESEKLMINVVFQTFSVTPWLKSVVVITLYSHIDWPNEASVNPQISATPVE